MRTFIFRAVRYTNEILEIFYDVKALETHTNKGVGAMNVGRIIVKVYSDMEMLSSFNINKGDMENERN